MNYSASVIDEVAPAGSKGPPSPRAAETAALGQTEKEIRRAESRRLAIAAQGGCIESFESLVGQFEKPLYHFLLAMKYHKILQVNLLYKMKIENTYTFQVHQNYF